MMQIACLLNQESKSTEVDAAAPFQMIRGRHGLMLVNVNDWYMGRALAVYGECNQIETAFLLAIANYPGTVVEVGANMGIHTIPLAQRLRRERRQLIAFEPQPLIFQQLCANLLLNGCFNVRAWPCACAEITDCVFFVEPNYAATGNFGAVSMTNSTMSSKAGYIKVPCIRLDEILKGEMVGLLKIDVEGSELQVLKGASETIQRCRPLIYVENDRTPNSRSLIEWLWDADYTLWWHTPPMFNLNNFFGIKENLYPKGFSINMLAAPKEVRFSVPHRMPMVVDSNFHPLLNPHVFRDAASSQGER